MWSYREDKRLRPGREAPAAEETLGRGPREGRVSGESRYCSLRCTTWTLRTAGAGMEGTWVSAGTLVCRVGQESHLPLLGWVIIMGTSWSRHPAGKCGRKEKGRKTGERPGQEGGGVPTELEKGPNSGSELFQDCAPGPRTRDTGGRRVWLCKRS